MKLLSAICLLFLVLYVSAYRALPEDARSRMHLMEGKQRRWLANDLKEYHAQMAKIHKNYIPSYPDSPVYDAIWVGWAPRIYWVTIETGSETFFLLDKNYPGRGKHQAYYDPAQSRKSKYVGNYTGFSGSMEVSGRAFDDFFSMDGKPSWGNTTSQRFGVVDHVDDTYTLFPTLPDGVLGLSWNPDDAANPSDKSSPIVNFFAEHPESDRYWMGWLEDNTTPEEGRLYSMVTAFGAKLDWLCQPIEANIPLDWLPASQSLAFHVDSFTYKDQRYAGGYAKVDTGVPNILVPYDSFIAVYNDVQPDFEFDYGIYSVDCSLMNSLPDWTFAIAGQDYVIPSSSYVIDLLLPDGKCALSIHYTDEDTTDFVFGIPFHNLWCLIMDIDKQAIGFSNILPEPTGPPELAKKE